MIRVVSGALRGRRLQVPQAGARPTAERVRAAIFDALRSYIDLDEARVLDLYAGSGALGFEAVSRGAETAVLVEHAAVAVKALRANIASLGLEGRVRVQVGKVQQALAGHAPAEPYDLVLADPPYDIGGGEVADVLGKLASGGWIATDGMLVFERAARAAAPTWPDGLEPVKSYLYGDTRVEFARPGP
ncbi:16S rRNA (guanine(966)-N(2))-methyltransferase RsmD [Segniliparus rugosus]|uniref:RsmD family RNA methyltransferase n=1 Tax=Segniliparus rugosus (strain ATCC BAA-974 / DSM 45345 / CCUG 50838 / CIP 108380 / JCM 13579 / CDC 945) TaxID=679197 RepID=E5XUH2_SEGRC|nr:16S rRNA (guanine(966)-N(2))-methyltransferase RsmD [Segniliparus rugosus]EFV11998.1 RsmD family RNA methyltransferase [Segniliparus rugosus ATCC BAA-974]